ncbi:MAG: hypothetical protein WBA29_17840 [Xanthobacteraceae bacterium]
MAATASEQRFKIGLHDSGSMFRHNSRAESARHQRRAALAKIGSIFRDTTEAGEPARIAPLAIAA